MTMTLYLKYRSKNIDELDLKEVRETLEETVKSGRIPHAFLFSGPKGTGKTSAARILAKILNCEKRRKNSIVPCDKCEQCKSISGGFNLDVIELDAASHRGIDDIRALREAVKLSPGSAQNKVYIIDEAHMLTTEASNALLKTLEEPPKHVYFILATTNPEKLIETVRSRVTNIVFRKADEREIVRSLRRVVAGEKIKTSTEALKLIAHASDGSFRDAIKILEQLTTQSKSLKEKKVEEFVKGYAYDIADLLDFLRYKDLKKALGEIEKVQNRGVSMDAYAKDVLILLRKELLAKHGIGNGEQHGYTQEKLIELIELMSITRTKMKDSLIESLPFEIAIIKWCKDSGNGEIIDIDEEEEEEEEEAEEAEEIEEGEFKQLSSDVWKRILTAVKPVNTSIEALLKSAKPLGYDGKYLRVGVFYKFHKERLEEDRHRRAVEDVIKEVLGRPVRILCSLSEPPKKKQEEKKAVVLTEGKDEDIIEIAEKIFSS